MRLAVYDISTRLAFKQINGRVSSKFLLLSRRMHSSNVNNKHNLVDDDASLSDDERVEKLGKAYHDEYNTIKTSYRTPKHPIVLCHGLLGFDSMRLGEFESLQIPPLAVIHYWKGIKEALEANGNEVFITRVPRTATVEERAEILAQQIQNKFGGRSINLIGHSMVNLMLCTLELD